MGVRAVHPARKHKTICPGIILSDRVAAEANTLTVLNFRWEVEKNFVFRKTFNRI